MPKFCCTFEAILGINESGEQVATIIRSISSTLTPAQAIAC
ncbi:Uncharacterised protein [Vibrio cholerae]|nr:Uncharacterised protein [Vibrio cholerae]